MKSAHAILAIALLIGLAYFTPIGIIASVILLILSLFGALLRNALGIGDKTMRIAAWAVLLIISVASLGILSIIAEITLLYLAYRGLKGGKK